MRRSFRVLVTTAAAAATLVATAVSTTAAVPVRGGMANEDDVLVAMQRDLGLSASQIRELRTQQSAAVRLDVSLRSSLGGVFGGSWFDVATGVLVVGVTDRARVAEVVKAGARAVVVERGEADLYAILDELNTLYGKGQHRKSPLAGLARWHVDPKTNSVVVTMLEGHQRPAVLAKYGDAVTYAETDRLPRPAKGFMDGGDAINSGTCSAGFNLRNPATVQGFLLTAGHCTAVGQENSGNDGTFFGYTVESTYPGDDEALIRRDNLYWYQGPWVDQNPSFGYPITVSGYSDVPVGTVICKAGITTKWTCGLVQAKDETVLYDTDLVMYGLTQHNACVEPGDSGGANLASLSVWSTEGVTSGAQMYWDGSRLRCGEVGGLDNFSWYFPIADSLSHYGPTYGLTTW
jgi:streptogrisin C